MTSDFPYPREISSLYPPVPRRLRLWSRYVGMVFAAGTFIAMVASAEWRLWLVLTDPLAWMMLILASAAGITAGYALGCRMPAKRTA